MEKINFKDGELVKGAYITINDEEIPVTEAEYAGDTPLSSYVMNKLQDNIEKEIAISETNLKNLIEKREAQLVDTNVDFNEFVENGRYYLKDIPTGENRPCSIIGFLEVFDGGNDLITQIYTSYNGKGIYCRGKHPTQGWLEWELIGGNIDITTGIEVETGRIINNKKEYMKRISTGNLTTGGEKTIATGLTNITQQRPITGVIGAEGQANFDIPLALTSYRVYCRLNSTGSHISIGNAGDLTAFSGFVDLYYTKN